MKSFFWGGGSIVIFREVFWVSLLENVLKITFAQRLSSTLNNFKETFHNNLRSKSEKHNIIFQPLSGILIDFLKYFRQYKKENIKIIVMQKYYLNKKSLRKAKSPDFAKFDYARYYFVKFGSFLLGSYSFY